MDQQETRGPAEPAESSRVGETAASVGRRIDELRERAAACSDPREQADLHRSADSLARLALALDPPAATWPDRGGERAL